MRRIVILNRKGGVGKTTTVVNLAHALAILGKKVLVVDCDGQRNATQRLLNSRAPIVQSTVLDLLDTPLTQINSMEDLAPFILMTSIRNVNLIPGDPALDEWERSDDPFAALMLKLRLRPLERYDYVLLDTGPSWSLATRNAFCAASEIIIPLTFDEQALQGIIDLQRKILEFSNRYAHPIRISKVVPIARDLRFRGRVSRIEQEVEKMWPRAKAPSIRTDGQILASIDHWTTVFHYNMRAAAAEDYLYLAEHLIQEEEDQVV